MDNSSNTRKWLTCGGIIIAVICVGTIGVVAGFFAFEFLTTTPTPEPVVEEPSPTAIPTEDWEDIPYKAVVQIIAQYKDGSRLEDGWTGSGTIISSNGYILTNAHVVLPDKHFPVDALIVALTIADDRPAKRTYYAEVVQADKALDLAVIKITTDLDGVPVDHASLDLPYVPLGDASSLSLGDKITILGYPGIGGATITLVTGVVGGFTEEEPYGDRAFIKTSAAIAGGNSGGLVVDDEGYLIAIPTQLGYGGDDQFVDCRVLADTNRDGVIDERDSCVPTGGFINALRPVNLAIPLIEAALRGEVAIIEGAPTTPDTDFPDLGSILFEDDFSDPYSGWGTWSEAGEGFADYVDGTFQIQVLAENSLYWSHSGEEFTDVVIDVDTHVIDSTGDSDYGVICRYQDSNNFYGLEVSEGGYYSIWKFIGGELYYLIEWRSSSFLLEQTGDLHITAACVADTLALAVNGQLIAEVHDSDISSGDVGLIVGTWDTTGILVAFDNFIVSEPSP